MHATTMHRMPTITSGCRRNGSHMRDGKRNSTAITSITSISKTRTGKPTGTGGMSISSAEFHTEPHSALRSARLWDCRARAPLRRAARLSGIAASASTGATIHWLVSAVVADARNFQVPAISKSSALARQTCTVLAAVPTDTHALSSLPFGSPRSSMMPTTSCPGTRGY